MDKKLILWVIIAILVVGVIIVTVKSLNIGATQQAVSSVGQAAGSSGGGMVGGC